MKSIEERSLEIYPINNLYFDRIRKLREAYIRGATKHEKAKKAGIFTFRKIILANLAALGYFDKNKKNV